MKTAYNFIFILFLLASVSGCSHDNIDGTKGLEVINIGDDYTEKKIKISDVVEDISYVKLETDTSCLIGEVDFLIPLEDRFIIADARKAKAVYMFSREGKFMGKIGRLGQGPEEYTHIIDVKADPVGKRVMIVDVSGAKMYTFDGKYAGTVKIPGRKAGFISGGEMIASYMDYKPAASGDGRKFLPNIVVSDASTGERVDSGAFYPSWVNRNSIASAVYSAVDFRTAGELVMFSFSDTLYSVSENGIRPAYLFYYNDGHQEKMTRYLEETRDSKDMLANFDKYMALNTEKVYKVLATEDVVYIYLVKGDNKVNYSVACLYYPAAGTLLRAVGNHSPLYDSDMDEFYDGYFVAADRDSFYSVIPADAADYFKDEDLGAEALKVKQALSPDDNPVIVVSRMKKL